MTEDEALIAIERDCRSGDIEGNGCQLDRIITSFLKDNGYTKLAEAMGDVDCWRA